MNHEADGDWRRMSESSDSQECTQLSLFILSIMVKKTMALPSVFWIRIRSDPELFVPDPELFVPDPAKTKEQIN